MKMPRRLPCSLRPSLFGWLLALLAAGICGVASAQSQTQRCDGYAGKVAVLCDLLPRGSCPFSDGHPCYRSINTEGNYRLACMSGRFGDAEYQRDLTRAQSLVDECRYGTGGNPTTPTSPLAPPLGGGKPCGEDINRVYRNLLQEAADLRQQVADQQRQGVDPGAELARRTDGARESLAAAAAALESLGAPELAGVERQMRQAQLAAGELRGRLPRTAADVLRGLEEQQRIVANQISLIRERADAQRCALPAVPPPAPLATGGQRLVVKTARAAVAARIAPALVWGITAVTFSVDEAAELDLADAFNARPLTGNRVSVTDTGSSTEGSSVTTPEATVRSERTLYLVARDPARAVTFVHVGRGAVTVAPVRGAAQRVDAGQAAIVNANSVRLVAQAQTAGGFEADTNRNGSDYASFDLPTANPQICSERCRGDAQCRAWTYVKPGVQGANARCYLKNPAPEPTRSTCCISGAVAAPPAVVAVGVEVNTNRVGSDYTSFDLAQAVPEQCAARCTADGRCAAWTFVRPGVQGPSARCYLKDPAPPPTPNGCCVSGLRTEVDTNRQGSDYASFDLAGGTAQQCAARCEGDGSCRAWTFVKPGVQGPGARCYLKNPAPAPTPNNCCVSGVVKRAGDALFEQNTNRRGADYANFDLPQAVPELCYERCRGDARCLAWTFVKPGVQGASARCWLKTPAPAPAADTCCISGAIAGRVAPPPPPPPTPPPPPPRPPVGTGGDYMVSVATPSVRPYARIEITFRRPASRASHPQDWIGMAPAGSPNDAAYSGDYWAPLADRLEGTVTLPAPPNPGNYEIRMYLDNVAVNRVAQAPFTVVAGAPNVVLPPVTTPPVVTPPTANASLGTVWNEIEETERAVWTRRPGTNTFDASWSNGRVRAVLEMAVQGNQVTIRRSQSTDGYECTYTGTISGDQASGTFGCNRFGGQKPWRATIQGGGAVTPGTTAAPRYLGCFKDPNNPFDLDGHLERSPQNTPERCVQTCAAKGFAYAGVQYAESCLCGNAYGRFGAAQTCNMPCTGNRGQTCGGANANSVYSTGVPPRRP